MTSFTKLWMHVQLNEVLAIMSEVYSTAKLCLTQDGCVPLDPGLNNSSLMFFL